MRLLKIVTFLCISEKKLPYHCLIKDCVNSHRSEGYYEIASTWKQTQKTETSSKWNFLRRWRFLFLLKNFEICLKFFKWIYRFFNLFAQLLGRVPIYMGLLFLRDFQYFRSVSLFFGSVLVFWKSFKFTVCLYDFSFFRSVSDFQNKFQIPRLLICFLNF